MRIYLTFLGFFFLSVFASAQGAVEDILVEVFYEADVNPFTGKAEHIKTYRIYVDLNEDYSLQAVFGNMKHPLVLGSTEMIYNEPIRGVKTGNWLNTRKLEYDGLFLDSFVTLSSVSNSFCAIMKEEDENGSIYAEEESRESGVVAYLNQDKSAISLSKADGMINCMPNNVQLVRLQAEAFDKLNVGNELYTTDGCWATMGGVVGPTPSNRILIAQITTSGELYYELNLQIGLPEGGSEQYVAKNATGNEVELSKLILAK